MKKPEKNGLIPGTFRGEERGHFLGRTKEKRPESRGKATGHRVEEARNPESRKKKDRIPGLQKPNEIQRKAGRQGTKLQWASSLRGEVQRQGEAVQSINGEKRGKEALRGKPGKRQTPPSSGVGRNRIKFNQEGVRSINLYP